MNNITLKSIKCESVRAIFSSIADAEKISRAEISEKTDLSLVTVGKAVDALLEMNIIRQVKEVKAQAGRRAGMLAANPDKYAVILDITSCEFSVSILDLRLNLLEKYVYADDEGTSYQDNIKNFIRNAAVYVGERYGLEHCFGVGVSCPGPYNEASDCVHTTRTPELCSVKLRAELAESFAGLPFLIDSHINAATRSNIMYIDDYDKKNIVYWYVGSGNVCGAFAVRGEIILGRDNTSCEFGKMYDRSGLTLEERVALSHTPEDFADSLAQPMYTIIKALNPHTFIVECDIPYTYEDIVPLLKSKLIREFKYNKSELPEFHKACCKFRNSHRGLTMGLRDMWLDRLVFG